MMKQFKKKLVAIACCLSLTLTMLPAAPTTAWAATAKVVTLNDGYLNLRQTASTGAKIVGKLYNGDAVSEISTSKGWSKITVDGKSGYVKSEYLKKKTTSSGSTKPAYTVSAMSGTAKVTGASSLRVRSGPSTSYSTLGNLSSGAKVTITGKASTGWYQITYNGKKAFCSSEYLTLDKKNDYTVKAMSRKGNTTSVLNVRSGPSTSYGSLGTLKQGQAITITGQASTKWYQISYNGKKAFVSNDYVKLASDKPSYTVTKMSETAVVSGATTLTVRSGPSSSYSSVGTLKKGATVTVTGKASTGWYRITYNGKACFVSNEYLTIQKKANVKGKVGIVTGDVVNVRAGATTDSKKLGTLNSGSKITLAGSSGNWYQFKYQGKTAYISADYVRITNESEISVTDYAAVGKVVNTSSLNVRSGASADHALVGTLKGGAEVTITGKAATGWYRINFNGKAAYVSNSYIELQKKTAVNRDGTVNASQLNVRKGAGNSYAIVDTLSIGKIVKVLSQIGDWYQISYDGKAGYVTSQYVTLKKVDSGNDGSSNDGNVVGKIGIVTTNDLNFRTGPGTDYSRITQLSYGTRVDILESVSNGEWYKIKVGDTVGYVSAEYIRISDGNGSANDGSSMQAAKFLEAATREIGYVEEANGASKYSIWYDSSRPTLPWCATFVSWCANEAGILDTVIPKFASCSAGIQWFKNAGLWQPRGDYMPKTGDIIFYDWSGGTDPDHVGIVSYVSNGKVTAIEGNTTDSVAERTYALTSSSIIGYGTPAYSK